MARDIVQTDRPWFPRAAMLWADQQRGIYPWPKPKKPKADGTYPVVKSQILKDLGITTDYHNQRQRIWENPFFLKALEVENRRRDLGIEKVTKEIEKVVGPLHETRSKVIDNVKKVFEREPDEEDPLALSPQQYVKEGREWIRYIDETEGRTESEKEQTIDHIMSDMARTNRVNAEMIGEAMGLLTSHRREQDERLSVYIEGTAEDVD